MMTGSTPGDLVDLDDGVGGGDDRLTMWPGLREGVVAQEDGADLVLSYEGRTTRLRHIPDQVRAHLAEPSARVRVDDRVREATERVLSRLGHLTTNSLRCDAHEVMRHECTTRTGTYSAADLTPDDMLRLDRFALLRSRNDALVLECPRSTHRFILTCDLARGLAVDLGTPRRVRDVVGAFDWRALVMDTLRHWVGAGLVEKAGADGRFPTDADPRLVQWDFHDLLMHTRSRSGRHDEPLGALSPHRGRIDPLPAVVPPRRGALEIDLPRPGPWTNSVPVAEAVEQRRSIRDYSDTPLTVDELAAFLYRAFRDRARFDPVDHGQESKVSRPYPSGGGLYEHELYLTVRRCDGVDPGIYHYDALGHRLELLTDRHESARAMLAVAAAATGHPASPDVLLTLTARFQRVSWRYRSIAYANVLRTTGAIYQTMYLVATDLDLAPCALGNGDADLAARVLGLDYLCESSVGDFLLGRRRPEDVVQGEPLAGWTLLEAPPDVGETASA